jgi:xanthine dehydrogenase YagS FAD-binding subunit
MRGNTVRDVRLTFGGVATKPWRSPEAEAVLRGKPLTATTITEAGRALVRGVVTRDHNAFKVDLVQRALDGLLRDLGGVR